MPTAEEFAAYEKVRASGKYNMVADAEKAAKAAGLTRARYALVLMNYSKCAVSYGGLALPDEAGDADETQG